MQEVKSDLAISPEAASYIAQGLRALAHLDGLHTSELALVEAFERAYELEPADGKDFDPSGGGPLEGEEKEIFLRTLQLMALADGRISGSESKWIEEVSAELDIPAERRAELERDAKKQMLGSLSGVTAFREQAVGVGRSLGLSDADIDEVLGAG